MAKSLVIVESPTKANTIRKFLGAGYEIDSSYGHIRDLPAGSAEIPAEFRDQPWAAIGINYEKDFEPIYVVSGRAKQVVTRLKGKLKEADELILATDEDREGEGISWHLVEVLKPKVPVKRIVFHEITKEAIQHAIKNPRQVDENVVRAQEARRLLDRLVGYTVSPLLWTKIAPGLSAGRVQSVAVELVVVRERERMKFVTGSYWDLKASLRSGGKDFEAVLASLNGKRIANGKDFDENTGKLKTKTEALLLDEAKARALQATLKTGSWTVSALESKEETRQPARPFTTSTLQQEANRKFGWSANQTMKTAQALYENGFITYMRTDSESLSSQAVNAARAQVADMYGDVYLSPKPRNYSTRNASAQEAHEAIRPAGSNFKTPAETGLSGQDLKLYDLIWKRTVATQMAEARMKFTTASIVATGGSENAVFKATGKEILFPGFIRAYFEGSDDPEADIDDQEKMLPPLKQGDSPACSNIDAVGHQTKPPARFTEATLIKELEKEGVGRPSTYASIIENIMGRDYVRKEGNQLVPTFTAFAVTGLLEHSISDVVDVKFTSEMEQALDTIAEGKLDWKSYLHGYYNGADGLRSRVESSKKALKPGESRKIHLPQLENSGAELLLGQYGPYVKVTENGEVRNVSLPEKMTPAELTADSLKTLLVPKDPNAAPDVFTTDPATGESVYLLNGPYGPYVQLGKGEKPKRASLLKGMKPETLTPEIALQLLTLPRRLGTHPETGKVVNAAVGKFGPYVAHDGVFASVAGQAILTIQLSEALELLAKKKAAASGPEVLAELGVHPQGGVMQVLSGRYGPYIKWNDGNYTLPKGSDPKSFSVEQAVTLIQEAAAKPKAAKRPFKKAK
jgi:DNA topoisomerase-1